jgi:cation:H+ antiporter
LSFASQKDLLFAILGAAMMAVYGFSFLFRPKRRYFRLGIDSIIVVLFYILGMIVLSKIS